MARTIKIDNAELKRREHKKRKRTPKPIVCRILIVCEGEKTEPNYFKSFDKNCNGTFIYELDLQGGGINTIGVVDKAIELRDKAHTPYDRVWAVFDKDSFSNKNFNGAITKATANNIDCAWSNEAFELWFLLHFYDRSTGMHRTEYEKALTDAVNSSGKYPKTKKFKYKKNDAKIKDILDQCGSQKNAIKWAEALNQTYDNQKYSDQNPCTTVYKLVRQIIGEDEELNQDLTEKVDQ
jgi:hypothetical protein